MTRLFQIYITEAPVDRLPPVLEEASQELRACFIDAEYSLWNDASIRAFLTQEFEGDVLKAYDNLIPFAYRSDLARYCLLYHFGGWYADLGIRSAGNHVVPAVSEDIDFIFFWDLGDLLAPFRSFYDCMNGLLFSRPGNPVLATAIELVVKNSRNHFYGCDSMSPTGPGVLGRAIAIHGKSERHYDGHFLQLTPQHHQKNRAYVTREGVIIAWHRSRLNPNATSLADLGAIGTNDYRLLWKERRVYRDQL
jgi:mannosyltransferase OCH1-like enzyme